MTSDCVRVQEICARLLAVRPPKILRLLDIRVHTRRNRYTHQDMDDQKIWALIEAINRTHFHAISELALYTGVADHKCPTLKPLGIEVPRFLRLSIIFSRYFNRIKSDNALCDYNEDILIQYPVIFS